MTEQSTESYRDQQGGQSDGGGTDAASRAERGDLGGGDDLSASQQMRGVESSEQPASPGTAQESGDGSRVETAQDQFHGAGSESAGQGEMTDRAADGVAAGTAEGADGAGKDAPAPGQESQPVTAQEQMEQDLTAYDGQPARPEEDPTPAKPGAAQEREDDQHLKNAPQPEAHETPQGDQPAGGTEKPATPEAGQPAMSDLDKAMARMDAIEKAGHQYGPDGKWTQEYREASAAVSKETNKVLDHYEAEYKARAEAEAAAQQDGAAQQPTDHPGKPVESPGNRIESALDKANAKVAELQKAEKVYGPDGKWSPEYAEAVKAQSEAMVAKLDAIEANNRLGSADTVQQEHPAVSPSAKTVEAQSPVARTVEGPGRDPALAATRPAHEHEAFRQTAAAPGRGAEKAPAAAHGAEKAPAAAHDNNPDGASTKATGVVNAANAVRDASENLSKGMGAGEAAVRFGAQVAAPNAYDGFREAEGSLAAGKDVPTALARGAGAVAADAVTTGAGDAAVNIANDAAKVAGAPQAVTDATAVAASATGSQFTGQVLKSGAEAGVNLAKAAGGDASGIDKQVKSMEAGAAGTPLQGYAIATEAAANVASGDSVGTAVDKAAKAGEGSVGARAGEALGDAATQGEAVANAVTADAVRGELNPATVVQDAAHAMHDAMGKDTALSKAAEKVAEALGAEPKK